MDNLIRVVIMEANRNISNQSFKGIFLTFKDQIGPDVNKFCKVNIFVLRL